MEAQVLLGGQVGIERGVLEHEADVAAHGVPFGDHVVPGHDGAAGRRPHQGAEDADGGRLAGAVRPEEPERLPRRDLEVDAADGLDIAVLCFP